MSIMIFQSSSRPQAHQVSPHQTGDEQLLSLNFAKVNWKYSVLDAKTSEKPEVVGRDLTQQKKM